MGIKNLIEAMKNGDISAINTGLNHSGAIFRINGIINAVRHKLSNESIINKISELQNDEVIIDTYSVSEFAIAAIHILGKETYHGNNEHISSLIECNMIF